MPGVPCVTPSHIAGTPPATCAVAPRRRASSLDDVGIALVRRVGREHVVVGGDDADVGRALGHHLELVVGRACRPRHAPRWRSPCGRSRGRAGGSRCRRCEVGAAQVAAALADALGDLADGGMCGHGVLRSAAEAAGRPLPRGGRSSYQARKTLSAAGIGTIRTRRHNADATRDGVSQRHGRGPAGPSASAIPARGREKPGRRRVRWARVGQSTSLTSTRRASALLPEPVVTAGFCRSTFVGRHAQAGEHVAHHLRALLCELLVHGRRRRWCRGSPRPPPCGRPPRP